MVEEILDDKEIAGKTKLQDDIQFILQAFLINDRVFERRAALVELVLAELHEIAFFRLGQWQVRIFWHLEVEVHLTVALLGHEIRVFNSCCDDIIRNEFRAREAGGQLFFSHHIITSIRVDEFRIFFRFFAAIRLHVQVMHCIIFFVEIMHVICRYERNTGRCRHLHKDVVYDFLLGKIPRLNLEIERIEAILITFDSIQDSIFVFPQDCFRDFATDTRRKCNDALAIFLNNGIIRARLIVKTVNLSIVMNAKEILYSLFVLRKQDEMPVVSAGIRTVFQCPVWNDIGFHPDDSGDACFLTFLVEFDDRCHAAMVSHGNMRQAERFRFCNIIFYVERAVANASFRGMCV